MRASRKPLAPVEQADPAPSGGSLVPAHVAIIMDGNGRWASARGLPRIAGHREGARAVRRTVEAAIEQGVGWLTIYAFSSENWRRPAGEVLDLTGLLRQYLKSELAELRANGVRLRVIGEPDRFGADLTADLREAVRSTASNTRLNLTVALSYGARAEIAAAARSLALSVREGHLAPSDIDEEAVARCLFTDGMPDPDLLIRTSGEQRLSNFLLWQTAYAEFVFQDVLWPDYGATHLATALAEYARRERRFGARPA
ncbi:MAG: isoprenyl transferase [Acetobacteraceae bacterium]|nr:isoprenyl transferase [Acetobacteraceae bacterium]